MVLRDRDLVTRLLRQSILTLCREAVHYSCRLEVDGIICLTVDGQDQHVVKIHEFFDRPNDSETENLPTRSMSNENIFNKTTHLAELGDHESRKTLNASYNNIENISSGIKIDADNLLIKPDPDRYSEMKQEDDSMKETSLNEPKSTTQICSDTLTYVDYSSLDDKKLSMSSATNILCKKCNSTLENVELFQVHNMTSHNHFTCLVCLATFTSRNNMKRHIRLHTGIKPYSCHKCPESFSRNDDFKRHLLKHTFQRPFRCAHCKTGYSDRACVKTHMMKEHNTKVYHVCSQCGESYIDIVKFQQHKKLHPELQDYQCSVCSFTGSNSLMYNKHMLTHGPLKEYKCTYCNMSYSDPFMYTSHLKRHKGDEHVQSYTCCFCDMTLQTYEQFQRHEHTHVHSKQHVCEICHKVFRYPSNLREHMLTHLPKSTYQGTRSLLSGYDDLDKYCFPKEGGMPLTTTARDESFNSELRPMETDEENNNKINTTDEHDLKHNEADKETSNGCSDYWCAECSHGFGTESELQNHISNIHETKGDVVSDDHENDECTNNQHITKKTNPYEDSTQIESEHHHVYNEETVADNSDYYNDRTRDNVKGSELQNTTEKNTEQELNTVTDAMRQVKDIQSRFGIKSIELNTFKPRDKTEQDTKPPLHEDYNVENQHSWLKPSVSVNRFPRHVPKQMFVSLSGTKMKIQRTSYSSLLSRNNGGAFSIAKESRKDDNKVSVTENAPRTDTDISEQNSSYKKPSHASTRSTSTTLNLKVRNPGFERVVTPDVLFKTKAPFTCEVCEETFQSFDEFHEHGVKIHRRFICSYCGKVFTSRPNRERHIRYHTGEKPYKCELCLATFLRGDDLKYHRTTKHADIKPFTCGACQTSFSLPKDLEKHLKLYPDHKL